MLGINPVFVARLGQGHGPLPGGYPIAAVIIVVIIAGRGKIDPCRS